MRYATDETSCHGHTAAGCQPSAQAVASNAAAPRSIWYLKNVIDLFLFKESMDPYCFRADDGVAFFAVCAQIYLTVSDLSNLSLLPKYSDVAGLLPSNV
jgi:hypothetical protein